MKIHLHIPYQTKTDENLCAVLFIQTPQLPMRQIVNLQSTDGIHWEGQTDLNLTENATLTYAYYVLKNRQMVRREWNVFPRQIHLSIKQHAYHLYDWWRELPSQSWRYSAALTPFTTPTPLPTFAATVILQAIFPGLTQGQKQP